MLDDPSRESLPVMPDDVFASVLVFNNNAAAVRTLVCLREQVARPAQVVVIDNASAEPFADHLGRVGTGLLDRESVVRLEANRGVGAGHNVALRIAAERGFRFAWLLEHDTFVGPTCLQSLLAHVNQSNDPNRVVAKPVLARNRYEARILDQGQPLPGERHRFRAVQGHSITFNGLLLSTELARRIGPIREDLVVGFEDYVMAKQLQRVGAELIEPPEVLGVHPTRGLGRYPEAQSPVRCFYSVRNFLWIRGEETGRTPWREAVRASFGIARDIARWDPELARARARGVWEGLRPSRSGLQVSACSSTKTP